MPDRRATPCCIGLSFEHGGNIEEAAQYNDQKARTAFAACSLPASSFAVHEELSSQLKPSPSPDEMEPHDKRAADAHRDSGQQEGHCLNDPAVSLLKSACCRRMCAIVPTTASSTQLASYNIPFHHSAGQPATKARKSLLEADHRV
jgi:formyltetrahydrofolate deformylase